jgi:hypothetical protein
MPLEGMVTGIGDPCMPYTGLRPYGGNTAVELRLWSSAGHRG